MTAVLWGAVPLALTPIVSRVDPVTISWFRFLSAGLFLLAWFAAKGSVSVRALADRRTALLYLLAAATLVGNYVLYVYSLHYITAPVAQIVIQVAPVLLMLSSLWLFRERFGRVQWIGFLVLVFGIGAFCAERLRVSGAGLRGFGIGVVLMLAAALSWTIYGLAQKKLLEVLSSQLILMAIYLGGALMMLPLARPADIRGLDAGGLALLLFLAANTLVAYGAFAEALARWEASKVSAVLALQPLTTLFGAYALGAWFPRMFPEVPLTPVAVVSALVVVTGSMACALGGETGGRDASAAP